MGPGGTEQEPRVLSVHVVGRAELLKVQMGVEGASPSGESRLVTGALTVSEMPVLDVGMQRQSFPYI